jgi:hypothetical protein
VVGKIVEEVLNLGHGRPFRLSRAGSDGCCRSDH